MELDNESGSTPTAHNETLTLEPCEGKVRSDDGYCVSDVVIFPRLDILDTGVFVVLSFFVLFCVSDD